MSDLTVALLVLALLVLAALAAHGIWQSRRAGPRLATEPGRRGEQREPVMDAAPSSAGAAASMGGALPFGAAGMPDPGSLRRASPRLDALIDAVATLTLEVPITGEMTLAHLPATHRAGSKPFFIEAMNAETGAWEVPAVGARYAGFQAGVQLANRTGALNQIEYSEFVQKVQSFADSVGALADFPDMLDAVVRARELDAFASQRDAQLAVHLKARSVAWSAGYIQQHAARHGFVAGALPGRLVLPSADDGAPPVLLLNFDPQAALSDEPSQAAVRDVTLSFDVPQTPPGVEPFAAWQASAVALALGMDAAVIDDNGQPLSPAGFDSIGSELNRLYAELEARDLAAGSAAARRLFS